MLEIPRFGHPAVGENADDLCLRKCGTQQRARRHIMASGVMTSATIAISRGTGLQVCKVCIAAVVDGRLGWSLGQSAARTLRS
jgi:hypothetical protein